MGYLGATRPPEGMGGPPVAAAGGLQELEALQKAIALEIHDPDSGTDDGYVRGGRG